MLGFPPGLDQIHQVLIPLLLDRLHINRPGPSLDILSKPVHVFPRILEPALVHIVQPPVSRGSDMTEEMFEIAPSSESFIHKQSYQGLPESWTRRHGRMMKRRLAGVGV